MIGRSLRACIDLGALGERTITIDCDVLQADGGTRCAAITGSYAALAQAFRTLRTRGVIMIRPPLTGQVAAVSVGITAEGRKILDLCYTEDSSAQVDMNVVRTDEGRYIEIQGTAEAMPFTRDQMDAMMRLADRGLDDLIAIQRQALAGVMDGLRQVVTGQG